MFNHLVILVYIILKPRNPLIVSIKDILGENRTYDLIPTRRDAISIYFYTLYLLI